MHLPHRFSELSAPPRISQHQTCMCIHSVYMVLLARWAPCIKLTTVYIHGSGQPSHRAPCLFLNNVHHHVWKRVLLSQGILSSFFYKYADTILKKYSSTIATIFTALASWALFGHTLTVNFLLGVSIVLISMHQVCFSVCVHRLFRGVYT